MGKKLNKNPRLCEHCDSIDKLLHLSIFALLLQSDSGCFARRENVQESQNQTDLEDKLFQFDNFVLELSHLQQF